MSARFWDDSQLRQVHAWRLEGRTWDWIGARGSEPADTAKRRYSKLRASGLLDRVLNGVTPGVTDTPMPTFTVADGERIEWTEGSGRADLWSRSSRIRTLEQLLESAEVDLTRWYVHSHTVNVWEMGSRGPDGNIVTEPLFQVKATLRVIAGAELVLSVVDGAIAAMSRHSPAYEVVEYADPTEGRQFMLEVAFHDVHLAMLAWAEETGGADWDSYIAPPVVANALDDMLGMASGFPVAKVLLVLGGDFLHADSTIAGSGGATNKGTSLDVDSRLSKTFGLAQRIAVAAIDRLRLIAPVEVLVIPGNHDLDRLGLLGSVLEAWYRNDESVTIRNEPRTRKYVQWGTTLLGFTHGHLEKSTALPLIMATEAPHEWAATTWREFHRGHTHGKNENVSEHSGVRVRVIPSLAPEDAWHAQKGYRHLRCAECYLWDHDSGFAGMFSVNARHAA